MLVETGALDSGGRHLCELLENRLVKLREVPTLFAEHASALFAPYGAFGFALYSLISLVF